jgi:DNA-binding transcriptional ArsR family regulator
VHFSETRHASHAIPQVSCTKNPLDIRSTINNHKVVDTLTQTFAALCDPTRRAILQRLTQGPATVSGLAEPFAISQQAISKHLACLENARLIAKKRRGREHFCTLEPQAIKQVADWADNYRRFWEASHQRLDVLLETMKSEERQAAKNHKSKKKGKRK